ncbi:MAG TPA: DUF2339 domain-containing protein [Candidatus Dormibacteraeota bacterium]|nr:DUF2339 domain-containing protein [Candidatus Dormibacteraeota bacterium]
MDTIGPLILFVVGCVLAGPILALVALARIRRMAGLREPESGTEAHLDAIDARVATLSRRVAALERSASAGTGAAPAVARPAPAPMPPPVSRPPAIPPTLDGRPPDAPPPGPVPRATSRPATPRERVIYESAPPSFTPPRPPTAPIDWERWIGIRGAAVVGAVALGLAGLLFFKYSIEKGLITPEMRVVFGTFTGLGCLVGSEWLRSRGYRQTSEGISGAGVVILYAAFWAAHVLYGLIGLPLVFGLMVLVTAACCLLAVRHSSLLVAVLGLVGGFATPILLASGTDRPIGLFGYVLLLDLGLLAVGRKGAWPSLGVLCLLGTVLMQGLWIIARMGPERLFLGLVILAVFALLFVVAGRLVGGRAPSGGWLWSQVGAILFPFVFALYFAGRVEMGPHLYPIAILLGLLSAGACWVGREQNVRSLGTGAAAASLVVTAVWLLQHTLTTALAWETVGVTVGLSAIYHIFVEIDPEPVDLAGPAPAALLAAGGYFILLLFAAGGSEVTIVPWVAGWTAIAGLLYRHAAFPERGALQIAAAAGLGLGLSILHLCHHGSPVFPPAGMFLALLVTFSVLLQLVAQLRRDEEVRLFADRAAGTLPLLLLVFLAFARFALTLEALPALGSALTLGVLAMTAATRLAKGAWYAAAVGATLLVHVSWTFGRGGWWSGPPGGELMAFLVQAGAVVVFTAWPHLAVRRFSGDRFAWYAAALAGPLWFPSLRRLFVLTFGDTAIGALPIALGALSLVAADRARRAWPAADPIRRSALVWFSAVALGFVAVAIPLQLEKQWITIGWALDGLAMLVLWKRLDHPGLKYLGLSLLGATSVRLVANPALLGYYPRSSVRIVNWLMYTYFVPAAALLAAAVLLKPLEMKRTRPWEKDLYSWGHQVGAIGSALAAIIVIFVWINLAIADWFATGEVLTLRFGDEPAQRLTVSIAWGIYALILLGFGMARDSLGLRWISLCFLLVTIGKVFLYDLGALQDLYRVASLVGLAVSLILVSLLYQRFVFRKAPQERP